MTRFSLFPSTCTAGLSSPYLFKLEGDKKAVQQLVSLYNQGPILFANFGQMIYLCYCSHIVLSISDPDAVPPENTNPLDSAVLIKCYLASLPEPLTTFELYDEIRSARSGINVIRNVLKRLPTVNYMTLEFITALLLRVNQKSVLNKA